jgi:hypothetical protein
MSLGQVASSPQPSAPSAPPAALADVGAPDATGAPPVVDKTAATALAPEAGQDKPGLGHNGGPDWRAMIAGEDAKAIEALSRYQTPADFYKSWNEQRAALSKRAEPPKLPDNATPEQLGEWRKGLGLPEIGKDAKPDDYISAYKIEMPKDYQASEVEKGMIGDFAKLAYERGMSPREVKESVGFFFQAQQANVQALNRIDVDFQRSQQHALRDELGSREYDAQREAGEAWLRNQFRENPDEMVKILHAQMPGGGKLGDSAWFFKLVAKEAMGSGYTDRIEANAMESGGKPLAQQQHEIEKLMHSDRTLYSAPQTQERLKKIIAARQARGEIDEWGNERKRA